MKRVIGIILACLAGVALTAAMVSIAGWRITLESYLITAALIGFLYLVTWLITSESKS